MPNQQLLIIEHTSPIGRIVHAKGYLKTGDKVCDDTFIAGLKSIHGCSNAYFEKECAIKFTVYDAFVDDMPRIEEAFKGAVCALLEWEGEVEVRYKDSDDDRESESYQAAPSDACDKFLAEIGYTVGEPERA